MSYHIRVRPTALVIKDNCILLVEYKDDKGIHYNLPGGGAEPGETIIEGVKREVYEETASEVEVGPLAFVYECASHKQSGDYPDAPHTLNLIFECTLKKGADPRLPDYPDSSQSDIKWVPLETLDSIILFPNIRKEIVEYISSRRNIEIIEDFKLESYSKKV
ncbi:NUDIX domain-containing protein [Paenibacillus sp. NPDC057967]|uniref:NUDIX domain-containing protein n=1 Tax=Paenibacillus sp. NPDC057967 TaxID=3346293 RepID=UPI0036DBB62B